MHFLQKLKKTWACIELRNYVLKHETSIGRDDGAAPTDPHDAGVILHADDVGSLADEAANALDGLTLSIIGAHVDVEQRWGEDQSLFDA